MPDDNLPTDETNEEDTNEAAREDVEESDDDDDDRSADYDKNGDEISVTTTAVPSSKTPAGIGTSLSSAPSILDDQSTWRE